MDSFKGQAGQNCPKVTVGLPHFFYMGIIGYISAIPVYFLMSTTPYFITDYYGEPESIIGLFSWATLPYTLKIAISAILSRYQSVSWISKIGFYRFWSCFSQFFLTLLFYFRPNPAVSIFFCGGFALH
jgi:hypothetical protein